MVERELKAVVEDPGALKARLVAAGAQVRFAGRMADRRFDRGGELAVRDEVLRIREYRGPDGLTRTTVSWKGPTTVEGGYKLRAEDEFEAADAEAVTRVVMALGYLPVHAIDREVEYYDLGGAIVRLEWYPRMDVLMEVEGPAEAIDHAVATLGIARDQCRTDSLAAFVARYEARTGHRAAVSLAELDDPARDEAATS